MSSKMKSASKESCMELTASESPRLEVCTHLCLSDLKQIINLSVEESVSNTLAMLIENKMTPLRAEMSHLRTEIEGVRDVVSDFSQMNTQLSDLEKCVETLDTSLKAANCTAAAAPDIKRSLTSKVENLVLQQLENNLHHRKWALVISGVKTQNRGEQIEAQQIMLEFNEHASMRHPPMSDPNEGYAVCMRPLPELPEPPTEAPIYIPFQELGKRNLRMINNYLKEELNISAPSANHLPSYGRPFKKDTLPKNPNPATKLNVPTKKIVKTDEMRKTPPSLPPRKTDSFPKPPARRKKEKKPPLPEKIHTDHEDNQFYEEMNQMSLESSPRLPNKNMAMPSKKFQPKMNVSMRDDDGEHQSIAPSVPPPPRKIPDLPAKTFNDMNPSYKTSRTHSSISNRPRIEPPKEKSTENPLNAFRWYHGDSERIVVEKKLLQYKRDGMFAVRTSKTKGPSYPYAVTLYQSGKTYNFPIRIRDSDKRFALGTEKTNEPSFESLAILIDYFKTNQIKLMNNQSALLNIPLDRSS